MAEKIGIYVCHCGSNIAGTVDVVEVAKWAGENIKDVVVSKDYKFMCSSVGQQMIEEDIKNEGLTRVVVAACSPHLHEKTFRRVCQNAGLNPYLMQMTNLREHVSWVCNDKELGTQKAKALVSGSAERVKNQKPLEPIFVDINPVTLVVGGGIAGLQATLELANAGNKVVLVEREPSIGGHMAQFDKTFPTLDCSACILTPKMSEVAQHENVTLYTYAELEEVGGSIGSFKVKIRQKAKGVIASKCNGCGVCVEKCPLGALPKKVWDSNIPTKNAKDKKGEDLIPNPFEEGLGYQGAITIPFPQAVPRVPVIDRENCTHYKTGKCGICQKVCPTEAIDFDQQDEIIELKVGNIIYATGWKLFDCKKIPQYGYGRLKNVFTNMEFERLCNAAGPTDGKILLEDGTVPKSVAIIHCVGSRDEKHNPGCSNVCCMAALKLGHLVIEKIPSAEVTSFYIDMRTPSKDYEEFYQRLLHEGMHFIRGRVSEVTDASRSPKEDGKLIVQCEDTLEGQQKRIAVDMVILMGAIEPQEGAKDFGLRAGISTNLAGWYTELHPKLDPVATMTDGVFVAGCCQGPKDIPASVAQGAAAAARVAGLITTGRVKIEPIVAQIDETRCSGCRLCNNLCPYNAIEYDEEKGVSYVVSAMCKGCGTCVAACPANAISGPHFENCQVTSEIEGVLWDAIAENKEALAVGQPE